MSLYQVAPNVLGRYRRLANVRTGLHDHGSP